MLVLGRENLVGERAFDFPLDAVSADGPLEIAADAPLATCCASMASLGMWSL